MDHVQGLYNKKRSLELDWEQHYLQEGKYTLDMVRIDEEIRKVINHIKFAETRDALLQIKVENSAPEFSVAS